MRAYPVQALNQGMSRTLLPTRTPGTTAIAASAEPVMVRLRLIGQMEAWTLTAESVLPTGRKTRALLAVLALALPRSAAVTHRPAAPPGASRPLLQASRWPASWPSS